MRRLGFYIVVGLFASLIWASSQQNTVQAASSLQSSIPQVTFVAPLKSFADTVEFTSFPCEASEDPVSLSGGNVLQGDWPSFNISGSAIVTNFIVCPILQSVYAGIGVVVNTLEASGLLAIPPLLTDGSVSTNSQKALFAAWGVLRDLANVGLVIGLFLVVFSQATSYGLSAYGVKKMLPKVVIAALLVNLSYIICAILIDVFNILGGTLDDTITGALNAALGAHTLGEALGDSAGSIATAIAVFAGPAVLIFAFMILLILFLLLCFGLLCLVFLVARQVLIVCLVIAAPLAFISWLFPNTEGSFRKWWSTLIRLLAIYPIVMCLNAVVYIIIVAMASLMSA